MKSIGLFIVTFIALSLMSCVGTSVHDSEVGLCIRNVCIEGHVYYYTNSFYEGGIAPKLTDDGKPCHCETK